ncbi:hypothetical protein PUNSTDRAFT_135580 [Punctularia strigosozonata HHB-11173 SS5]|uniref:uncharacterized protein n=1 Tax=Punctularia strigosozonata (strain HHB-11173) TaxID=741275 RepID=UPI000441630B|nr:uncharacterized protein PUNSTDRAFT_135580 [Punctularia strigosozonata HHB-11173 SS5]EIN08065.1 hypothetical protein PUNSTDRAFT_135580 [Punctularia strigosozonata HHB-11173 SS5]
MELDDLDKAINTIKHTSRKGGKVKKAVDDICCRLILINSSAPSNLKTFQNLKHALRKAMQPVYEVHPIRATELANAVFLKAVHEKIPADNSTAVLSDGKTRREHWEEVARAVLSGLLDFCEKKGDERTKTTISGVFYPAICEYFFPDSSVCAGSIGLRLRLTAYSLLEALAEGSVNHQRELRDPNLLGPKKLGAAISRTHEPALPCGDELASLLQGTSPKNWEETAMRIVDKLASTRLDFPQPFALNRITACGTMFEQPESWDRLLVDARGLLVSVENSNGEYESLEVPYTTVVSITLRDATHLNELDVEVALSTPPIIGEKPMAAKGSPSMSFQIQKTDLNRFHGAIEHRGLGGRVQRDKLTAPPRSRHVSVAQVSVEFDGIPPPIGKNLPLSFPERLNVVKQTYGITDASSESGNGKGNGEEFFDFDTAAASPENIPPTGELKAEGPPKRGPPQHVAASSDDPLNVLAHTRSSSTLTGGQVKVRFGGVSSSDGLIKESLDVPESALAAHAAAPSVALDRKPPPASRPSGMETSTASARSGKSSGPLLLSKRASLRPLSRTASQLRRDVFGVEEELSEISDDAGSQPPRQEDSDIETSQEGVCDQPGFKASPKMSRSPLKLKGALSGKVLTKNTAAGPIFSQNPVVQNLKRSTVVRKRIVLDSDDELEAGTTRLDPAPVDGTVSGDVDPSPVVTGAPGPCIVKRPLRAARTLRMVRSSGVESPLDNDIGVGQFEPAELSAVSPVRTVAPADTFRVDLPVTPGKRKRLAEEGDRDAAPASCNPPAAPAAPARKRRRHGTLAKQESEESNIPKRRSSRVFQASLSSRMPQNSKYGTRSKNGRTFSPEKRALWSSSDADHSCDAVPVDTNRPTRVTRASALKDKAGNVKPPPPPRKPKPKAKKASKTTKLGSPVPPGRKVLAPVPAGELAIRTAKNADTVNVGNVAIKTPTTAVKPQGAPPTPPPRSNVNAAWVDMPSQEPSLVIASKILEPPNFQQSGSEVQTSQENQDAQDPIDAMDELDFDAMYVDNLEPGPDAEPVSARLNEEKTPLDPPQNFSIGVVDESILGDRISTQATTKEVCVQVNDKQQAEPTVSLQAVVGAPSNLQSVTIDLTQDTPAQKPLRRAEPRKVIREAVNLPSPIRIPDELLEPTRCPNNIKQAVEGNDIDSESDAHNVDSPDRHAMIDETAENIRCPLPANTLPPRTAATRFSAKQPVSILRPSPAASTQRKARFADELTPAHPEQGGRRLSKMTRFETNEEEKTSRTNTGRRAEPGLRDIVRALDGINDAILEKIARGFDSVRDNALYGRKIILQNVGADLQRMSGEAAERYNVLIELEAEYAAFNALSKAKYGELVRASSAIVDTAREALAEHARHDLSKKFPRTLGGLPQSMLDVLNKKK